MTRLIQHVRRYRETYLLAAGTALLLVLQFRYYTLSLVDPVLARDEANDVLTVRQSWSGLWNHFVTDWVPFVYLLALRGWTALAGDGERAIRLLSFLCVLAADLLLLRGFARWFKDPWAALCATMLVGLSPVVLRYPVIDFARPYAMALFTAAFAFERFVALVEAPSRRRWFGFGVAALLMCNIQPVNLGFGAALALAWVILRVNRDSFRARPGWLDLLSAPLVLLASALPTVIQALRFREGQGDDRVAEALWGPVHYVRFALRSLAEVFPFTPAVVGYAFDDNLPGGLRDLLLGTPWEMRLLILVVLAAALWAWSRRAVAGDGRRTLGALALFGVPVLFLATAGFFNARMVVPWKSFSGVSLGAALLLVTLLFRWRVLVIALALLTVLRVASGYPEFAAGKNGKRSDARETVAFITEREQPDDLVVLSNLAMSPLFSYYYKGACRQVHHPYDGPLAFWHATRLWKDLAEPWRVERTVGIIREAGSAGRRVWFVAGAIPIDYLPPEEWGRWYSPDAFVACREALEQDFELVESQAFTTTLEPFYVFLYQPRPPVPADAP
jgi:hypothetical protein